MSVSVDRHPNQGRWMGRLQAWDDLYRDGIPSAVDARGMVNMFVPWFRNSGATHYFIFAALFSGHKRVTAFAMHGRSDH